MNQEMKSLMSGRAKTHPQPGSFLRGPSCAGEPRETAEQSLGRDLRLFTDAVNTDELESFPLPASHWINQELSDGSGQTLLLASLSRRLAEYSEVLLKAGAQAGLPSDRLATTPLHLAVKLADLTALKLLLDERNVRPANKADVNQRDKMGQSGLHLAVEQGNLPIIQFLLAQKNVNVDIVDVLDQTPLYLAVKNKSRQLVTLLLENGASLEAECDDQTIRQHILESMPGFHVSGLQRKVAPVVREDSLSDLEKLAELLDTAAMRKARGREVEDSLAQFSDLCLGCSAESLNTFQSSGYTFLQKCATANLADWAEALLQRSGVTARQRPGDWTSNPVLLAASRGHAEVLGVLKKYNADFAFVEEKTKETVLHKILQKDENLMHNVSEETLENVLDVILSGGNEAFKAEITSLINSRDVLGNTPLHYATQKWSEKTVRRLLERGANIGIKNKWDEIPINRISSSTMESFLDEFCLQSEYDVNHEKFKVTFDYGFLAPPVDALPIEMQGPYSDRDDTGNGDKKFALPETESLWYMAESKEHRRLLKHPVITSFLWCKWTRIRRFVNRNLRFYMFFVMLLTWFIFEKYGGNNLKSDQTETIPVFYGLFVVFSCIMFFLVFRDWVTDVKDMMREERIVMESEEEGMRPPDLSYPELFLSNWLEFLFLASLVLVLVLAVPLLPTALSVLTVLLAGREIFQMTVSLRRYLLTFENWVEVAMVVLVSFLLFSPDEDSYELKRKLGAISLLLSWAELITVVARHPRLTRYNVYVTMFLNVLKSFAFFLLWFGFYIFAFAMGFYIMLHKDHDSHVATNTTIGGEEEGELQPFFDNPFLTFVKSLTMFVGELEFSAIPIDRESSLMPLSYLYFLAFVLLIVVVLMNLLNGLAVSDIREIKEEATTVAYHSIVDTVSYTESILLGDPFDFLSNVPALSWLVNVPSLSCCRQIYRSRLARRMIQKITGAQSILLFYNFLPDKKLIIRPNKESRSCVQIESLSQEIIQATRKLVLRQPRTEEERPDLSAKVEQLSQDNRLLLSKVDSLQQSIDVLMENLNKQNIK